MIAIIGSLRCTYPDPEPRSLLCLNESSRNNNHLSQSGLWMPSRTKFWLLFETWVDLISFFYVWAMCSLQSFLFLLHFKSTASHSPVCVSQTICLLFFLFRITWWVLFSRIWKGYQWLELVRVNTFRSNNLLDAGHFQFFVCTLLTSSTTIAELGCFRYVFGNVRNTDTAGTPPSCLRVIKGLPSKMKCLIQLTIKHSLVGKKFNLRV